MSKVLPSTPILISTSEIYPPNNMADITSGKAINRGNPRLSSPTAAETLEEIRSLQNAMNNIHLRNLTVSSSRHLPSNDNTEKSYQYFNRSMNNLHNKNSIGNPRTSDSSFVHQSRYRSESSSSEMRPTPSDSHSGESATEKSSSPRLNSVPSVDSLPYSTMKFSLNGRSSNNNTSPLSGLKSNNRSTQFSPMRSHSMGVNNIPSPHNPNSGVLLSPPSLYGLSSHSNIPLPVKQFSYLSPPVLNSSGNNDSTPSYRETSPMSSSVYSPGSPILQGPVSSPGGGRTKPKRLSLGLGNMIDQEVEDDYDDIDSPFSKPPVLNEFRSPSHTLDSSAESSSVEISSDDDEDELSGLDNLASVMEKKYKSNNQGNGNPLSRQLTESQLNIYLKTMRGDNEAEHIQSLSVEEAENSNSETSQVSLEGFPTFPESIDISKSSASLSNSDICDLLQGNIPSSVDFKGLSPPPTATSRALLARTLSGLPPSLPSPLITPTDRAVPSLTSLDESSEATSTPGSRALRSTLSVLALDKFAAASLLNRGQFSSGSSSNSSNGVNNITSTVNSNSATTSKRSQLSVVSEDDYQDTLSVQGHSNKAVLSGGTQKSNHPYNNSTSVAVNNLNNNEQVDVTNLLLSSPPARDGSISLGSLESRLAALAEERMKAALGDGWDDEDL